MAGTPDSYPAGIAVLIASFDHPDPDTTMQAFIDLYEVCRRADFTGAFALNAITCSLGKYARKLAQSGRCSGTAIATPGGQAPERAAAGNPHLEGVLAGARIVQAYLDDSDGWHDRAHDLFNALDVARLMHRVEHDLQPDAGRHVTAVDPRALTAHLN